MSAILEATAEKLGIPYVNGDQLTDRRYDTLQIPLGDFFPGFLVWRRRGFYQVSANLKETRVVEFASLYTLASGINALIGIHPPYSYKSKLDDIDKVYKKIEQWEKELQKRRPGEGQPTLQHIFKDTLLVFNHINPSRARKPNKRIFDTAYDKCRRVFVYKNEKLKGYEPHIWRIGATLLQGIEAFVGPTILDSNEDPNKIVEYPNSPALYLPQGYLHRPNWKIVQPEPRFPLFHLYDRAV